MVLQFDSIINWSIAAVGSCGDHPLVKWTEVATGWNFRLNQRPATNEVALSWAVGHVLKQSWSDNDKEKIESKLKVKQTKYCELVFCSHLCCHMTCPIFAKRSIAYFFSMSINVFWGIKNNHPQASTNTTSSCSLRWSYRVQSRCCDLDLLGHGSPQSSLAAGSIAIAHGKMMMTVMVYKLFCQ